MSDHHEIDEILGLAKDQLAAPPALPAAPVSEPLRRHEEDEEEEPNSYRPYMIRGPIPAFDVVEASGKRHLFAYHALKHPQYETENGEEVLSFFGDGAYCIVGGKNLLPIYKAMQRHRLHVMRCYDGKLPVVAEVTCGTMIDRLEVHAAHERLAQGRAMGEEP
jgi:hypothetical protein